MCRPSLASSRRILRHRLRRLTSLRRIRQAAGAPTRRNRPAAASRALTGSHRACRSNPVRIHHPGHRALQACLRPATRRGRQANKAATRTPLRRSREEAGQKTPLTVPMLPPQLPRASRVEREHREALSPRARRSSARATRRSDPAGSPAKRKPAVARMQTPNRNQLPTGPSADSSHQGSNSRPVNRMRPQDSRATALPKVPSRPDHRAAGSSSPHRQGRT